MDSITAHSGAVLWDAINGRITMTHDEMAVAVRADLVRHGDSTLGSVSHRLHVSCPVLIEVLHDCRDTIWHIRKVPLRDTSLGLTSAGMDQATEEGS